MEGFVTNEQAKQLKKLGFPQSWSEDNLFDRSEPNCKDCISLRSDKKSKDEIFRTSWNKACYYDCIEFSGDDSERWVLARTSKKRAESCRDFAREQWTIPSISEAISWFRNNLDFKIKCGVGVGVDDVLMEPTYEWTFDVGVGLIHAKTGYYSYEVAEKALLEHILEGFEKWESLIKKKIPN